MITAFEGLLLEDLADLFLALANHTAQRRAVPRSDPPDPGPDWSARPSP